MFKKLRNRMLLINMLLISALILSSVSTIYCIAVKNTVSDIDRRLGGAVSIMESRKFNPSPLPPKKEENSVPEAVKPSRQSREHRFEPIIAVCIDNNGAITDRNTDLVISEYIDDAALLKVSEKIISGKKEGGIISMLYSRWDYKCKKTDDGYIIAMGQFSTEHKALLTLFIISLPVCLGVIAAAFFISLYNANRNIRPIEESYNSQKQFIADASHELKTPLTTINTNIDVLLSHKEKTIEEEQKWLYYIKSEAQRMTNLTNDLLYLARLTHDDNELFSRVSFSDNLESVILSMEAVAFEKEIYIEENIEENVFTNASDALIKQLVMILLDNAIKYTPKNGKINILLNKDAVLKIKNTGNGITAKDQKHIFERFFRSDESRSRESGGYGLGLSIAKAICDKLNGTISVFSKENEYTEFTVKLPLNDDN